MNPPGCAKFQKLFWLIDSVAGLISGLEFQDTSLRALMEFAGNALNLLGGLLTTSFSSGLRSRGPTYFAITISCLGNLR
jgi:hypothetical protein